MAISFKGATFIEQKKRQQLLLLALAAVVAITGAVLWLGFFRGGQVSPVEQQQAPAKKVEIDFGFFESPLFKEVGAPGQPFQVPKTIGRGNPFVEL